MVVACCQRQRVKLIQFVASVTKIADYEEALAVASFAQ